MTEPTLIERLNLDREVLLGDLWDEAGGNEALREAYKTIARNTQEAISALHQREWIKIEDMPPNLMSRLNGIKTEYPFNYNAHIMGGYWADYYSEEMAHIWVYGPMYWSKAQNGWWSTYLNHHPTHYMLPPQPPEQPS